MKKGVNKTSKIRWGLIVIIVLVMLAVSSFGSMSSVSPESNVWYNQVKSSLTPPGYVFGIVWTILYVLIGISIYLSLKDKNQDKRFNKKIILFWMINLIMNALWTYLFFEMKEPLIAFSGLLTIFVSCAYLIKLNWKKHLLAANLLWPYLAWLCFAGLLNYLAI